MDRLVNNLKKNISKFYDEEFTEYDEYLLKNKNVYKKHYKIYKKLKYIYINNELNILNENEYKSIIFKVYNKLLSFKHILNIEFEGEDIEIDNFEQFYKDKVKILEKVKTNLNKI